MKRHTALSRITWAATAVTCAGALLLSGCAGTDSTPSETTTAATTSTTTQATEARTNADIIEAQEPGTTFAVHSPETVDFVATALQEAGVPEDAIAGFRSWAESYAEAIPYDAIDDPQNYQTGVAVEALQQENPRLVNCRMLTYLLAGHTIDVAQPEGADTSGLFMDHEQMDREPALFTGADRDRYNAIYGRIAASHEPNEAELASTIIEYQAEHGITFAEDKILPIDVYLHDTLDLEAFLFIGHTGLAIPYQGKYLFLEKLSFEEPFQATWYDLPQDIVTVVRDRYDDSEATKGAAPIVTVSGTYFPGN